MKLYLSSYRIPVPAALFELIGKPASDVRVALLPNAKDYQAPEVWEFKVSDFCTYLKALGPQVVAVVDLRNYSDQKTLENDLQGYDLIWALGGNTFCLRYEMRRSGFENVVRNLLERGVVYGGDSAGAIVAGRSLTGAEYGDQPELAKEIITEGLQLVNFGIVPHVDNADFAEMAVKMGALQEREGETVLLKDNEAIVVDGGRRRIVQA